MAQIAVNERPWFEDQGAADEELFVANDRQEEAIAEESKAVDTSAVDEARARVEGLETHREEIQVAYHMSRYVTRARVVRRPLIYPHTENYRQYNENGKYAGLNWVKWIGHVCSPLPKRSVSAGTVLTQLSLPACPLRFTRYFAPLCGPFKCNALHPRNTHPPHGATACCFRGLPALVRIALDRILPTGADVL